MRLLAIDTAGDGCSAGIFTDADTLALRYREGGTGHAELLPRMLEAVLAEAGCDLDALDAMAVTTGPGSFTGIRTGLAMVRGLALVTGHRIFPVTTLAALAASALRSAGARAPVLAVIDARRGQVYHQLFAATGEPQGAAEAAVPAAAAAAVRDEVRLVGNGAALLSPYLPDATVLRAVRLDAAAVAEAARLAAAAGVPPVGGPAVRPFYARPADARADAGRSLLRVGG